MDYRACPSLPAMFFDLARQYDDKPAMWAKRPGGDGSWAPMTWREAARQANHLARGLAALGIRPGDRVALVAENRPEWIVADYAIMAAGAITVPGYVTNTVEDHRHILANSGAKGAIVSTRALAEKVVAAARLTADCRFVVAIEPPPAIEDAGIAIFPWRETLARGEAMPDTVAATVAKLKRGDLACIIHTSGTGGLPKGVALSHGAIIANCLGAYDLLKSLGVDDEIFLCFLPLSHSYEHTCVGAFALSIGAQVYFAEGADALARNMIEARPTIMTAVPRLYETMHHRITATLARDGGLKAKLFGLAVRLGRKRYETPHALAFHERLLDRLLDRLVRDKMRARFGGRLKALVSGGAPLNYDIGLFFTALGLRLLQGYGQTESAPVVSCNAPTLVKLDTVGPPLTDVEVKIAGDGEILVRGELVMQGYWNDPEATARTVLDGWLHTGDIGLIDADGYLKITDRKKDFIKNAGGEMIAPARVEGLLSLEPEIAQAMVYGDRRPYLVAVVVPRPEIVDAVAKANGQPTDLARLADDPALRAQIDKAVERVNARLPGPERVRRFLIAAPFTIDNEMMTPTLKIRRHKIREAYGARLDALYG
ncbi:MAG: long-chain fatty acid--CoA ligase [Rhodospirillales bacterium]|nr:long-chain fatty acid--CoA ligase [Rhodospirillales bacterium]